MGERAGTQFSFKSFMTVKTLSQLTSGKEETNKQTKTKNISPEKGCSLGDHQRVCPTLSSEGDA